MGWRWQAGSGSSSHEAAGAGRCRPCPCTGVARTGTAADARRRDRGDLAGAAGALFGHGARVAVRSLPIRRDRHRLSALGRGGRRALVPGRDPCAGPGAPAAATGGRQHAGLRRAVPECRLDAAAPAGRTRTDAAIAPAGDAASALRVLARALGLRACRPAFRRHRSGRRRGRLRGAARGAGPTAGPASGSHRAWQPADPGHAPAARTGAGRSACRAACAGPRRSDRAARQRLVYLR